MTIEGAYDPENIFVKIVRGDMPAAAVFENEDTLAFMDVFPQARGHVLVIHKTAPARNLLDVKPDQLNVIMHTVQRVARAVAASLKPEGVMIAQFSGAAAGQTVYHLHFHVIPRWEGQALGRHGGGDMADPNELSDIARQISAALT